MSLHQVVCRRDTGERVRIVEVLRYGTATFYRIQYEDGGISIVLSVVLR